MLVDKQGSVTKGWNFATVWEAIAGAHPEWPCLVHGDEMRTWGESERRAAGIAAALGSLGLPRQATVGLYLHNGPAYLEATFACWKAGLVPVNTNWRYTGPELTHLWADAECRAIVFDGTFTAGIEEIRKAPELGRTRAWFWVDDGSGPCPPWASPYETAAATPGAAGDPTRTGDDLLLLYTGGTTGRPKGVMWRQDDLFVLLNAGALVRYPDDPVGVDPAALVTRPGPRYLPGCPLMHGTGFLNALPALCSGGSVVTLVGRHFDAEELLTTIERHRVSSMSIVGDAFARPIVAALDAEPDRWDISSLRIVISSGVAWSPEAKAGLLRHNDRLSLIDALGASEAIGMGAAVARSDGGAEPARFAVSDRTKVLGDDGTWLRPGDGRVGRIAVRGRGPVGYFRDLEASAATFPIVDGERWSIPGDHATIEPDGTLRLLGRGSGCINTGGEKVYPEEVEAALRQVPGVADAAVVGVPDARFGEAVVGVIVAGDAPADDELQQQCRAVLAAYKVPRRFVRVDRPLRGPNGKLDYPAVRALAATRP